MIQEVAGSRVTMPSDPEEELNFPGYKAGPVGFSEGKAHAAVVEKGIGGCGEGCPAGEAVHVRAVH